MSELSSTDDREYDYLQQLAAAEDLGLQVTAQALSDEITARFDDETVVPSDEVDQYATLYTDSMLLSWLLGQYHVMQLVAQPVELADGDEASIDDAEMVFSEAIDFLRSQVPTDSTTYRDMEANIKLRGFTVAAVSSQHAVDDVKRLYEAALKTGQTSSEAKQNMNAYLMAAGVSPANPYYLELHYRNNMMTSYNVGRWTQVVDNDAVLYLVYVSVLDDGTTDLCRHLDHTIKEKTNEFWQKYYPPNHHKCRATVSPYSQTQYDALPDSVKNASAAVSDHAIKGNSTMAAEHQFKGSPVNTMSTLPASLMAQAQSYGLVSNILNYTRSVSGDVLSARNATLKASAVSPDIISKAVKMDPALDPFAEMAAGITQNADEMRLGFLNLYDSEDPTLAIQYLQQADEDTWLVGSAPAYTEDGVLQVQALTDKQRQQLEGNSISYTDEGTTIH
ncbi:MAG: phage minor head protein [Kluyvera sp.]|uniref:phage head morphogenesis protein n=1 Tax=Kluyvera sp. TaxID=1538228 RepID=UPI003A85C11A